MPPPKVILFVLLGLFALGFTVVWIAEEISRNRETVRALYRLLVGFITDFLDTLGIGSFATTTALYRFWDHVLGPATEPATVSTPRQLVADEKLPGTLNVGHTLPTCVQAFIYITIVDVEMNTLILLIAASVLGGWLGAVVVTRLPRRAIQVGLGSALLAAAGFILSRLVYGEPTGGDVLGLEGGWLIVAIVGNFVFGALMTIGVGAYAPIMIMVSLLGMNPKTAFPIMMGSCAFLMPVASFRFIRSGAYDAPAAIGLTLAGIPAVLLAAFIVKSLPLDYVRWGVIGVVVLTAGSMLWSAFRERRVLPPLELKSATASTNVRTKSEDVRPGQ